MISTEIPKITNDKGQKSIKIKFKEFNAQANTDEFDNTYLRNIADNKMEKDIEIWENSVFQRINEAKKLKYIL